MNYSRTFSILSLAISLSLLVMIALPATPVLAQSITLSPTSGFRGTKVTVTGADFGSHASSNVYLYFGSNQIKSVTVSSNGTFTTDFYVPVYATPGISHSVTIQDEYSTKLAEAWFIVGAKIDLDSTKGEIGDDIQISGRYFDANEEIRLYFSDDEANIGDNIDYEVVNYEYVGEATTNTEGYFDSPCSFSIPTQLIDGAKTESVISGDYYIYATYASGGKRIKALTKFVVTSGTAELEPITLSPTSGSPGTKITITGTDFGSYANSYVYIYFGSNQIKSLIVSDNGTFTTDVYVPIYATPGTSHSVTVQDEANVKLAEASFTVGAKIQMGSTKGEIGDWMQISGSYFNAGEEIHLYFSSAEANVGDSIDDEVTHYENIGEASINTDGYFDNPCHFSIPSQLTDGEEIENVYSGDYYIYATYDSGGVIKAMVKFVIIGIELSPKEGPVGSKLEISGEELGSSQAITVKYDGDIVEIVSGDGATNSDGRFTCTIIIPETVVGDHIITVIDESHKKYESVFSVTPQITIAPTSAAAGDEVKLSGTGFEAPYYSNDCVIITFNGDEVPTKPPLLRANSSGSFTGTFVVPLDFSRVSGRTITIKAIDNSLNTAEAQLTILSTTASISLDPPTTQTSPGHVGMNITAHGTRFAANAPITITYGSQEVITVATATTDDNGNFSATFLVPPSVAGDHTVTCTDSTNTATSIFTMESKAPLTPLSLVPEIVSMKESTAYLDWKDVNDPSGVTYTFQLAADAKFTTILLEKKGLTKSEYTITKEAEFESTKEEVLYYWRARAVDGAFNEGDWTPYGLLQVNSSQASRTGDGIGKWTTAIAIGLVLVALFFVFFALRLVNKYR